MGETVVQIALEKLVAHPQNSNVMSQPMLEKLAGHMKRSGRYPPIIVRPKGPEHYQILDGHHRVKALTRLGAATARCVVWHVDDEQALVLLATLNRLEGSDDARKRAALVDHLAQHVDIKTLGEVLPEQTGKLKKMLALNRQLPPPRAPAEALQLPEAVYFFLTPEQRRHLDDRLNAIGGSREAALMHLVTATKKGESHDKANRS